MAICLEYKFEVETTVDVSQSWHYEPHYDRKVITVDYDYWVEVSFEDFFEYHKNPDFEKWSSGEQEKYIYALKTVWNADWFDADNLEYDEDFIEFMKERHEQDAYRECEDEYAD